MAIRRYTAAQLLALRESPLVHKPDNLPAIEQWIEYVYLDGKNGEREKLRIPHSEAATSGGNANAQAHKDGTQRNKQRATLAGPAGGEASPMGSFSTGRPTLTTRGSALRGSGEDISLGPPRPIFPSSRNITKLSDLPDRNASSSTDATPGEEPDNPRSRFFSERQLNRRSVNNEKEGKDSKDSWTSVRERREAQKERTDRFGHDKEDGERRNGFGDRHDPRWSNNREDRRNGDRPGGWREREQHRRDRDGDRVEKEPEWMEDPVVKKDQELGFGMPKTQEEFQKWKESMAKKTKGEPDKEAHVEAPSEPPAATAPEPKPSVAPLKLEGFDGGLFGGWGSGSSGPSAAAINTSAPPANAKSGTSAKPKTSRFASMFKPAPEEAAASAPPGETDLQKATNGVALTSAEDHEGFNRVLQMLGSAKLGQTPTPQETTPASPPPAKLSGPQNGTAGKPKSRFTDMFAQKSPERLQSPQQGGVQLGGDGLFRGEERSMAEETPAVLSEQRGPARDIGQQQRPRTRGPDSSESSGIPFNAMREQQPRPTSGRVNDMMFDPPSRGAATPDINIQNLLAQQRQRPQATSNESQTLLNLLKKDTSNSRPPSQQALPNNGGIDQAQLQRWLEHQQQGTMPETHAPKPRVPQQPPGLFEEQLMRNFASEQRPDQAPMPAMQEMPQPRATQRAPPGFFDEQSILLQQQQQQYQQQAQLRRQFQEGPPPQQQQPVPTHGRKISGHPALPQMQIPNQQQQQFPPDYHQLASPGGQALPPPGFNPHMPRHPPGFHNINIFQQPQPQQREPPPPGFGAASLQSPNASAPPGFFNAPQGMPPGFMPQMRSPVDGMPPQVMRGNGRGFEAYDPNVGLGPRR